MVKVFFYLFAFSSGFSRECRGNIQTYHLFAVAYKTIDYDIKEIGY